ncbi:MAG: type II secretion system protein [Planctomycetota bacterium]
MTEWAVGKAAGGACSIRRKGFTLVELLIVVAIIALLVSILAPSLLSKVEKITDRIVCASGMKQLGTAWVAYANDNDKLVVGSNTGRSYDWVRSWGRMKIGALYPYVNNPEIYKCTNPYNPSYPVSYSISGRLNGEAPRWWRITDIPRPSETLVLIEEDDWRGYNVNSWMLVSVNRWEDYVSGNHDVGDNLIFASGHAEYWKWENPRTLTIPYHEEGFFMPDPGNQDLARLWRVWDGKRRERR